jgi:hypothetical protein
MIIYLLSHLNYFLRPLLWWCHQEIVVVNYNKETLSPSLTTVKLFHHLHSYICCPFNLKMLKLHLFILNNDPKFFLLSYFFFIHHLEKDKSTELYLPMLWNSNNQTNLFLMCLPALFLWSMINYQISNQKIVCMIKFLLEINFFWNSIHFLFSIKFQYENYYKLIER